MSTGVTLLPCPKCRTSNVNSRGPVPACSNCGYVWADWKSYWVSISASGVHMSVPPPVSTPPVEDDTYISSGQMQYDIEQLVLRAVAEAMLNFTDRLAHDVITATTNGDYYDDQIRAVQRLVRSHRDKAREEWAEVASDE